MKKSDRKYRMIFYTHDGAGLGHLTRISRIAEALSTHHNVECMVVSGFREMSFVVNKNLHVCKLPSRDSMIEERANYWNQHAFIDIDIPEVYKWRRVDMETIFSLYMPDAFFIDYYVTGKREELLEIIKKHHKTTLFYYINRGIIGCEWSIKTQVLTENNCMMLEKYFKRIFLTNDESVFDFTKVYDLSNEIKNKWINVGYISKKISAAEIKRTRTLRNVNDKVWVVCTAGGGKLGESFIETMIQIATEFPEAEFDIISGPRNSIELPVSDSKNCRYHKCLNNLSSFIAAADICITTGGYNTMTEAMSNDTYMMIKPSQLEKEDEQFFHASLLSLKMDTDLLIKDENDLKDKIREFLKYRSVPDYSKLNMNGLKTIKKIVLNDLNVLL